jgi:SAM-dependent methyltransferase
MVAAARARAAALDRPFRILEIGAGIGTMAERWNEYHVVDEVDYTLLDADARHLAEAIERLRAIAGRWQLRFEAADVFDFAQRERGRQRWDTLIAHAFLDLVDVSQTLPLLFDLLQPGGLFYFTINFDGETILEPPLDPELDELVIRLYHQTMDERTANGRPSGDRYTGRHLFKHIPAAGGEILAAGSSDWVVFPQNRQHAAGAAYFLHSIIETIGGALTGHPQLDGRHFANWIDRRHQQVDDGSLVYIAHQLDFFGRVPILQGYP